jgi:hypothetical protein
MSNATYVKRDEGNVTVFEVTPATAPKFWWFIIIGAILLVGGIADLNAYSHSKLKTAEPTWILTVFPGILLVWLGSRDWRPKAHRGPSAFAVTADSVTTNGVTITNKDIHRLIVRNPKSDTGDVVVVTVGMPIPGQVAGRNHNFRLGRVCNSLDLEAGGKAYVLAGGMDETTVFGLLSDVAALLGRRVQ